jgi:Ca-activated chloride channel family protein
MFELAYPWVLLLLPLPLLVFWLLPTYKEERDAVRFAFFQHIVRATGLKASPGAVVPRSNLLQKILAPLCWGLLVLALARPQFVEPPIEKIQPARDLMLALDISQSMETPDFRTPEGKRLRRVDAVKEVVSSFIQKRVGDRIGLIVFGTSAYPVAPFTLDHKTCLEMLDLTQSGMAGPQTVIGDAIGLAIKQFEASDAKQRVLILLTDGNDTGSRMPPDKAASIAKQRGILIHVVGLGDPHATGQDKVDYAALQRIASATGGQLFHGENQQELQKAYDTLDALTPQNHKVLSYRPKRPLFMYPLAAATILLLGYHLLMLAVGALRKVLEPKRLAGQDSDAVFGVHL